ncbi:Ig-like domain-containing protein [Caulobacter segnis]|uniref:Ig-like domain-containing protein n=1 Tax=Caulobacter segnis TaxID=88688 RepID=UPI00240FEF52|nr:Ig-like domain-containing protein [Caulobacter segnis]MDG2520548.1 Ig-like domain-containing protein [Caulobacter segnis]
MATDTTPPSVFAVTVPENGSYRAGQTLTFAVTFDEDIIVVGSDATLGLNIGGEARNAAYSYSAGRVVTFTYTVQAGDTDANGISIGAITLGAARIQDAAGNDAALSLSGRVPSTAAILVDTTAPAAVGVAVPANGVYVAGQSLDFTVAFDENVTVNGADSTLGLTIGSATRNAAFHSNSGNTVTYRYTLQAGEVDTDGIVVGSLALGSSTIRDAAGNNASLLLSNVGATGNVRVDASVPSVSGNVSVPPDSVYVAGQTLLFTIAFDENLTITGTTSTLALTIGGALRSAAYEEKTANSVTYAYTIQAGDLDADGITINGLALNGSTIRDSAGNNANLSLTGHLPSMTGVRVDAVAPSVAITSSAAQLRQGQTATITFTFSETPVGFSAADIVVSGGVLGGLSGSGNVYTATFTPTDGIDGGSASITIAANSFTDAAANGNSAGLSPSLSFDTRAPTAPTLALEPASDTGASVSDGVTNNTRPTLRGLAESGSTVSLYDGQGNVLGSTTAVNGQFSVAPVLALAQGDHTITAHAVDGAGNASAVSNSVDLTIDTTAPTVAITSNVSQLKVGETAAVTFTFSEAPVGFSAADITVIGGTLGALSSAGGDGRVFTAVFTPTAGQNATTASITISAASYMDLAGNNGGSGTTPALTFDTLAPAAPSKPSLTSVSDSGAPDNITNIETPTFVGTAEAGALIKLFDTDGLTLLGQATANGQGDWTITSSALQGGHTVKAQATDLAGNTSSLSAGLALVVDTTAPSVAITSSKAALAVGETALLSFTFSEAVSGFTMADLVATGGTLGTLTPTADPKVYSVDFTYNGSAGPGVSIAAGAYTDVAGNANPAASLALSVLQPAQPEPQPPLTAQEIRQTFASAAGFALNSDKALASNITLPDGTVVPNPAFETAVRLASLISRFELGLINRDALIDGVVELAAPTSGVALSAYQFFTGSTPTKAGMAWLIDSPANANDLTDPYYARFNEVNRFINFAVNLGTRGEGAAAFEAKFGALDFQASVRLAYDMIIGLDTARAAGVNVDAALAWIASQEGYFDAFAGSDLGGKAAMIGYIMQAGFEAKVGRYYQASHGFIEDSFDGSPAYQVDLVGGQHLGT